MNRNLSILVLLAIIIYVSISAINIKFPGINSDELLFVNAVRKFANDDIFVKMRIANVPFMLTTYIGALKSYLYFPIFAVFGYSVESIRFPMIILMAFGIWLFYKATFKLTQNNYVAVFSAILLAFDPSILVLVRTDQGPVAIELFLKITAILLFSNYLNTGRISNIWFLGIVLFLGTFNKLNFIWSVNAILFGTLVYWKEVFGYFKKYEISQKANFLIALLFTYLPSVSFFLWAKIYFDINVKNPGVTFWIYGMPAHERLWYLIRGMLNFEHPFSFGMYIPVGSLAVYGVYLTVILIVIAAFLVVIHYKKMEKVEKFWLFSMFSFFAISVQLYLTWRAISVWHSINIFPFVISLTVSSLAIIYKHFLSLKLKSVLRIALVLITSYFIGIRLMLDRRYVINLGKPVRSVHWSNQIYDLSKYVNNTTKNFILLDWGTLTQLKGFSDHPDTIIEPYELRQQSECLEFAIDDYRPAIFYEKYLKNPDNNLFISMGDVYQFPSIRQQEFLKLLKAKSLSIDVQKVFQEDNQVSYTIYRIHK